MTSWRRFGRRCSSCTEATRAQTYGKRPYTYIEGPYRQAKSQAWQPWIEISARHCSLSQMSKLWRPLGDGVACGEVRLRVTLGYSG